MSRHPQVAFVCRSVDLPARLVLLREAWARVQRRKIGVDQYAERAEKELKPDGTEQVWPAEIADNGEDLVEDIERDVSWRRP